MEGERMPKYKVLEDRTIRSGGKFCFADEVVDLSQEAAQELIVSGHIEAVDHKPVGKKKPAVDQKAAEPGQPDGGGTGD
jgi:hypothetical protein